NNTGIFNEMYRSVRRLSAAEAAAIKPRRIQVVTVQRGETAQGIAARMAYSNYKLERFMTLNALSNNASVTPGQRVKIVIY
ncbi:MAG: LysM peptidoglycan-binding domain-containing protein, partial [Sphingomonadaceae bacterium]